MFNKQISPYTLQWVALSAIIIFLGLALFIIRAERREMAADQEHPPLARQSKHVPFIAPAKVLTVSSARQVWDYYDQIGFTLENLEGGHVDVPRIYLGNIINTWAENESVAFKKSLFYRTMLPLILRVNEIIADERQQLHSLVDKRRIAQLSTSERQWLHELAMDYKVISRAYNRPLAEHHITTLLRRVDIIPTSMALGQAAYESAYATSRFAMEGNALFGQWRWGSGLLPSEQREELGDYRIADFATPLDSMAAFAKNLNTNKAYRSFREMRLNLRQKGEPLSGYQLAAGLQNYSEKGEVYVKTLRRMIDQNNLAMLDKVKLGSGRPIRLVPDW